MIKLTAYPCARCCKVMTSRERSVITITKSVKWRNKHGVDRVTRRPDVAFCLCSDCRKVVETAMRLAMTGGEQE